MKEKLKLIILMIIAVVLIAGIVISFVTFAVLVIIRLAVINEIKYYEVRQKLDSDIIVQSFKTFANASSN